MSALFSIVLEFFKVVPHRWMPMLIPELETGGGGGGGGDTMHSMLLEVAKNRRNGKDL